jgi:hypothetical protein
MANEPEKYSGEVEMAGFYAGGVLGGLVFGILGDITHSEINNMAWYITGAVLGGFGGAIAATLFRRMVMNRA